MFQIIYFFNLHNTILKYIDYLKNSFDFVVIYMKILIINFITKLNFITLAIITLEDNVKIVFTKKLYKYKLLKKDIMLGS